MSLAKKLIIDLLYVGFFLGTLVIAELLIARYGGNLDSISMVLVQVIVVCVWLLVFKYVSDYIKRYTDDLTARETDIYNLINSIVVTVFLTIAMIYFKAKTEPIIWYGMLVMCLGFVGYMFYTDYRVHTQGPVEGEENGR